jgi:hypothetical protein
MTTRYHSESVYRFPVAVSTNNNPTIKESTCKPTRK